MREAVAMVVEEEEELLEQRRRALPAALGLVNHHLPSLAIEKIGRLSGLLLGRAESINEKIDNARESKGRRKQWMNKLHFVFEFVLWRFFYVWAIGCFVGKTLWDVL